MSTTFDKASRPLSQGWLFQWLRWRMIRHSIDVALAQSSLRLITVLLSSFMIWIGVFFLSALGFHFLKSQNLPLTGGIIGILFDFLFLALFVLLVFSSGLILYSSLFRSRETAFLLITPAAADQIFVWKFQGAVGFSSWAFVLLGSPILIAYGLNIWAPWYFYALIPLYVFGFVLLPGSLGALLCLLLVNIAPRRPRQVFVLIGVLLVALTIYWGQGLTRFAWRGNVSPEGLQRLLAQLSFAQSAAMPSHWVARGLITAARGDPDLVTVIYHLALVWSNGLLLYLIMGWAAQRFYRRGFNRVTTGGLMRRRYGGAWMDRLLTGLVGFLDPQIKLLIVKDFRTFRRDPAQWAQVLIFTGLLTLYFTNIRRLYLEEISVVYQNGISMLNLAATALLLCAYTGRFIYPMFSLEGRKFWILGLLPLKRHQLLWGKFAFSATGSLLIAEFLMILSDAMLLMPPLVICLHALTVAVLAAGLSGLSVGMGACMPNFQESDPSKIAVGFGGTLNLVVGLIFLVVVLALMSLPWHMHSDEDLVGTTARLFPWMVGGGVLAGLVIGGVAVVLPLWMGAEALQEMEF